MPSPTTAQKIGGGGLNLGLRYGTQTSNRGTQKPIRCVRGTAANYRRQMEPPKPKRDPALPRVGTRHATLTIQGIKYNTHWARFIPQEFTKWLGLNRL